MDSEVLLDERWGDSESISQMKSLIVAIDRAENELQVTLPAEHSLTAHYAEVNVVEKRRELLQVKTQKVSETMEAELQHMKELNNLLFKQMKKSLEAETKMTEQNDRIKELEQQLEESESRHAHFEEENERIKSDHEGMLDHSKIQSQTIATLEAELQERRCTSETLVSFLQQQKTKQDSQISELKENNQMSSQKIDRLELEIRKLNADLYRVRNERNELRENVQHYNTEQLMSLEESLAHCQQTSLAQQDIIDKKEKEIVRLKQALDTVTEDLHDIQRQKDEADRNLEGEAVKSQIQVGLRRDAMHQKASIEARLRSVEEELEQKCRECEVAVNSCTEQRSRADSYKASAERKRNELSEKSKLIKSMEEQIVLLKVQFHQDKSVLEYKVQCLEGDLQKTRQEEGSRLQESHALNEVRAQMHDLSRQFQVLSLNNQRLTATLKKAHRVQRGLNRTMNLQAHSLVPHPDSALLQYNVQMLEKFAKNPKYKFQFGKKIGGGAFGCVYEEKLDGEYVVVKRLWDILLGRGNEEPVGLEEKEKVHARFIRECILMSRTKHPNVVKFIGVHFGSKDRYDLSLLMEKLCKDLTDYLQSSRAIPYATKLSVLHDVSCGLRYLHEEHSIIHRDLTARNILLTEDNKAKIADLGVSKILNDASAKATEFGNIEYMPPEILLKRPFSVSIDIFSFGVLALFVSIQKQFPEFNWERVPDNFYTQGQSEIHKRRAWLNAMEEEHMELKDLILWCLEDEPQERPSSACLNITI